MLTVLELLNRPVVGWQSGMSTLRSYSGALRAVWGYGIQLD